MFIMVRGMTVVRVRFSVRGQKTMRKLAAAQPIKTEEAFPVNVCICIIHL